MFWSREKIDSKSYGLLGNNYLKIIQYKYFVIK